MTFDVTERIEQTHYCSALSVTGAWMGTNRQRLYDELGWESLFNRRWFRRLCQFFNLWNTRHPAYLFEEIPNACEIPYFLRNVNEYDSVICRIVRFSNTYFRNVLVEYNALIEDVRESNTLGNLNASCIQKLDQVGNMCMKFVAYMVFDA